MKRPRYDAAVHAEALRLASESRSTLAAGRASKRSYSNPATGLCFTDLADAQTSVATYFDYYSHKRRHSSIGYPKLYYFHQQLLANIT
jgi:hypothetical protein